MGVPVIGWDHGGVQEVLAEIFPQGAVAADDRGQLLARARSFLEQSPQVPANRAFGLNESMQKTTDLYRSVLGGNAS
jgi:hypothetical protein